MTDEVPEVSDVDWTAGSGAMPVSCRVTLAISGSTVEALAHQGTVVSAAASHGFDVDRVAVSRALSSAQSHRLHTGQPLDDTAPVRSALDLTVRYHGPVADAAVAMQNFVAGLADTLELVKASVGHGGDYHDGGIVVIN